MGRKQETRLIGAAAEEAGRIIRRESDGAAAAEQLEDLIDLLGQAEDQIRRLAGEAGLRVRPRQQVNFPDPRSAMQAAAQVMAQEAGDLLGFPTGDPPPQLAAERIRQLAPGLEAMIGENAWLGRYDEGDAARLAVAVLEGINREIARVTLDEIDPGERAALLRAATAEIIGEDAARAVMDRG